MPMREVILGGFAALLSLVAAFPAAAAPADSERLEFDDWLAVVHELVEANHALGADAKDALLAPMDLCSTAGCAIHQLVMLAPDEADELRGLMDPPAADSRQERRRIAQAVALYERLIGPKNGTDRDRAANSHDQDDTAGQLDCVAEAANTKTYLDRLALAGLLGHYEVGEVAIRFTLLLQHIAVEIVETGSRERWVVDSWPGAAGDEPVVEPYWDWRLEWQV